MAAEYVPARIVSPITVSAYAPATVDEPPKCCVCLDVRYPVITMACHSLNETRHSVCTAIVCFTCFDEMINQKGSTSVRCPLCREVTDGAVFNCSKSATIEKYPGAIACKVQLRGNIQNRHRGESTIIRELREDYFPPPRIMEPRIMGLGHHNFDIIDFDSLLYAEVSEPGYNLEDSVAVGYRPRIQLPPPLVPVFETSDVSADMVINDRLPVPELL